MNSFVILYINKLMSIFVLFLQRLAKYILKQDTPTCLEDALKIVAAYMLPTVEVYILRMIDLIDRERVLKYFMSVRFNLKTLRPVVKTAITCTSFWHLYTLLQ